MSEVATQAPAAESASVPFRSADDAKTLDTSTTPDNSPSTSPQGPGSGTDSGDLFVGYYESKGHPYSAKYFGVSDAWGKQTEVYREEMKAINKYIYDQIRSKELANTTGAAQKRLKELEKLVGVSESDPLHKRIISVREYINMMNRTKERISGSA